MFSVGLFGSPATQWAAVRIHLSLRLSQLVPRFREVRIIQKPRLATHMFTKIMRILMVAITLQILLTHLRWQIPHSSRNQFYSSSPPSKDMNVPGKWLNVFFCKKGQIWPEHFIQEKTKLDRVKVRLDHLEGDWNRKSRPDLTRSDQARSEMTVKYERSEFVLWSPDNCFTFASAPLTMRPPPDIPHWHEVSTLT